MSSSGSSLTSKRSDTSVCRTSVPAASLSSNSNGSRFYSPASYSPGCRSYASNSPSPTQSMTHYDSPAASVRQLSTPGPSATGGSSSQHIYSYLWLASSSPQPPPAGAASTQDKTLHSSSVAGTRMNPAGVRVHALFKEEPTAAVQVSGIHSHSASLTSTTGLLLPELQDPLHPFTSHLWNIVCGNGANVLNIDNDPARLHNLLLYILHEPLIAAESNAGRHSSTLPVSMLLMERNEHWKLLQQHLASLGCGLKLALKQAVEENLFQLAQQDSNENVRQQQTEILLLLQRLRLFVMQCHQRVDGVPPASFLSPLISNSPIDPVNALINIMKLSFKEEHRSVIGWFGGLETLSEVLLAEHRLSFNNERCNSPSSILLRRYACMCLTNLTFGLGVNKSVLCSRTKCLEALLYQLDTHNDELIQVAASVLRNLSWRADTASRFILESSDCPRRLMFTALRGRHYLEANKGNYLSSSEASTAVGEHALKSLLSALWNLSAHSDANKQQISEVPGAVDFLVFTLTYTGLSHSLAIVESGGGILRNVAPILVENEASRCHLTELQCVEVLLRQLQSSPSLTVVSNAVGTLLALCTGSGLRPSEWTTLYRLSGLSMLQCLTQSKHKLISQTAEQVVHYLARHTASATARQSLSFPALSASPGSVLENRSTMNVLTRSAPGSLLSHRQQRQQREEKEQQEKQYLLAWGQCDNAAQPLHGGDIVSQSVSSPLSTTSSTGASAASSPGDSSPTTSSLPARGCTNNVPISVDNSTFQSYECYYNDKSMSRRQFSSVDEHLLDSLLAETPLDYARKFSLEEEQKLSTMSSKTAAAATVNPSSKGNASSNATTSQEVSPRVWALEGTPLGLASRASSSPLSSISEVTEEDDDDDGDEEENHEDEVINIPNFKGRSSSLSPLHESPFECVEYPPTAQEHDATNSRASTSSSSSSFSEDEADDDKEPGHFIQNYINCALPAPKVVVAPSSMSTTEEALDLPRCFAVEDTPHQDKDGGGGDGSRVASRPFSPTAEEEHRRHRELLDETEEDDDDLEDEAVLQQCIHSALPSQKFAALRHPSKVRQPLLNHAATHHGARSVHSSDGSRSTTTTTTTGSDSVKQFALEGTPLQQLSKASSLSELSFPEMPESGGKLPPEGEVSSSNDNDGVEAEEDDDDQLNSELLHQVIQSAMPTNSRRSQLAGGRNLQTFWTSSSTASVVRTFPPTFLSPLSSSSIVAADKAGQENTSESHLGLDNTAALLDSTMPDSTSVEESHFLEDKKRPTPFGLVAPPSSSRQSQVFHCNQQTNAPLLPAAASAASSSSSSTFSSKGSKRHSVLSGSGSSNASKGHATSSISSLSLESTGMESMLLQECISSALPLPKSGPPRRPEAVGAHNNNTTASVRSASSGSASIPSSNNVTGGGDPVSLLSPRSLSGADSGNKQRPPTSLVKGRKPLCTPTTTSSPSSGSSRLPMFHTSSSKGIRSPSAGTAMSAPGKLGGVTTEIGGGGGSSSTASSSVESRPPRASASHFLGNGSDVTGRYRNSSQPNPKPNASAAAANSVGHPLAKNVRPPVQQSASHLKNGRKNGLNAISSNSTTSCVSSTRLTSLKSPSQMPVANENHAFTAAAPPEPVQRCRWLKKGNPTSKGLPLSPLCLSPLKDKSSSQPNSSELFHQSLSSLLSLEMTDAELDALLTDTLEIDASPQEVEQQLSCQKPVKKMESNKAPPSVSRPKSSVSHTGMKAPSTVSKSKQAVRSTGDYTCPSPKPVVSKQPSTLRKPTELKVSSSILKQSPSIVKKAMPPAVPVSVARSPSAGSSGGSFSKATGIPVSSNMNAPTLDPSPVKSIRGGRRTLTGVRKPDSGNVDRPPAATIPVVRPAIRQSTHLDSDNASSSKDNNQGDSPVSESSGNALLKSATPRLVAKVSPSRQQPRIPYLDQLPTSPSSCRDPLVSANAADITSSHDEGIWIHRKEVSPQTVRVKSLAMSKDAATAAPAAPVRTMKVAPLLAHHAMKLHNANTTGLEDLKSAAAKLSGQSEAVDYTPLLAAPSSA